MISQFPKFFWSIRLKLALLVLAQQLALSGCDTTPTQETPTKIVADSITVTLRVDFHGQKENLEKTLTLTAPVTAYSALVAAMPDEVESSGAGETLFIKSISKVPNQGAGKDNWTYRVNQQLGKTSCGISPLANQAMVEWSLGQYDPGE